MAASESAALADLKAALLKLDATGAGGFEGLLATILTHLTGQTFRLASSGTQGGEDGSAGSEITFEGKLYKGAIGRNDVLAKITSLIARAEPPELWILGATVGGNTQVLAEVRAATAKNGIATMILDWARTAPIPALAVLCILANKVTAAFLAEHIADAPLAAKAVAALSALHESPRLEPAGTDLKLLLGEAALGLPQAEAANSRWLSGVFADRLRALQVFGQPLAPCAPGPHPVLERKGLVDALVPLLDSTPDGRIVAILGGEGFGKSWLFAQAWLAAPRLTLLISAPELQPGLQGRGLNDFLISKLIEQTGDSSTESTRKRWEERLKRWAASPVSSPRFRVCVDGINQKADPNWTRWLDIAANAIGRLGGVLIVTVRRVYFDDHLRSALASRVLSVEIPEWSDAEVAGILSSLDLDGAEASPEVRQRLRNPRLLAIALNLLSQGRIRTLVELSVDRLLFEQIRTGAQDGGVAADPWDFIRTLSDHAREILSRIQTQQRSDQLVFDSRATGAPHTLSSDLLAVAGENFFHPLAEDPTRYTLTDDGLVLALGLALVDALKGAERNHRNVEETLAETLEPIAALDKTAEAVFAGALAASVDERASQAIRVALIGGFLQLQNIDGRAFAPFRAMLPAVLPAALAALEDLALSDRYVPHVDWLQAALRDLRGDPACWSAMAETIARWLRTYSRNPELDLVSHGLDADSLAARRADREKRQEELWAALSPAERLVFETTMDRRDDIIPGNLHQIAFDFLAGMPLASFALPLVRAALAEALNSGLSSPYNRFVALLRFNLCDGAAARIALRQASAVLVAEGASTTGRWARVAILRGLSTADDGAEEVSLVEVLTADRQWRKGWRRIEDYCATDPCDPTSPEPENIAATAARFDAMDMSALRQGRWVTQEDHFLRDALPGIARFRPDVGIQTIRRYARAALSREGDLQMFAATDLTRHAAALGPDEVEAMLGLATSLSRPLDDEDRTARDAWVTSQYALLAAVPHLGGDAQLKVLMGLPDPGPPLVKLTDLLNPGTAEPLDQALADLEAGQSSNRKLAVLAYARTSQALSNPVSRQVIARLARDLKSSVRSEAMAVILSIDDPAMIQAIVDSGWTAQNLEAQQNAFEIWRGSSVMVRALAAGMLDVDAALDRMSSVHYSAAAATGAPGVAAAIAMRLRLALARALDIDPPPRPPYAEQRGDEGGNYPPLYSLVGAELPGMKEALERLSEDPDAHHQRQREGHNAFNAFDAGLTRDGARLIVDNPGFGAVESCVETIDGWGSEVAADLLALPASRRMLARNFAIILAKALSASDPERAAALMKHFEKSQGYTGLVYGPAQVPLASFCVWGGADNAVWNSLRRARLDAAADDAALAEEILAALSASKSAFLEAYAAAGLASEDPVRQARALMCLGFGEPSPFADEQLERFGKVLGFLGGVAETAREAYERNIWSRHWRSVMIAADAPGEYWRAGVLVERIIDGRCAYWPDRDAADGSVAARFDPTLDSAEGRRVKGWQDKRKKTLFGGDLPPHFYVADELD